MNGLNIVINGGKLLFTTNFGLTVDWDGDAAVGYTLCDAYAKYVCGLCGNGDGKSFFCKILINYIIMMNLNFKKIYKKKVFHQMIMLIEIKHQ